MKIRILTFHFAINYGAILQTQGVVQHLKSIFPDADVKVLNYTPPQFFFYERLRAFKLFKKDVFFQLKRYLRISKYVKKNIELDKNINSFRPYSAIIKRIESNHYDLLVVGSDVVWKLSDSSFWPDFPNVYWLSPEISTKKITYAASMSGAKAGLYKKNSEQVKNMANAFDMITVRDYGAKEILQSVGVTKNITKILDPAFYYNTRKTQARSMMEKRGIDFNKKVIAILPNSYTSKKMSDLITHYKQKDYQVVGLDINHPLIDYNFGAIFDPDEWADAFSHMDFCITDRFHAAVFCIRHKTPFIAIELWNLPRENSKAYDLLSYFGLEDLYMDVFAKDYSIEKMDRQCNAIIDNWDKYARVIDEKLLDVKAVQNSMAENILSLFNK